MIITTHNNHYAKSVNQRLWQVLQLDLDGREYSTDILLLLAVFVIGDRLFSVIHIFMAHDSVCFCIFIGDLSSRYGCYFNMHNVAYGSYGE